MKKLLVALVTLLGLVFAGGAVATAGDPGVTPTLAATPSSGGPSFEFVLVLEPCVGQEDVEFVVPGDSDSGTCGATGSMLTSKTFTAPATPGVYEVEAILYFEILPTGDVPLCGEDLISGDLEEPCRVVAEITVTAPTTTTTTTTTVPDTTTTTTMPVVTTTVPATTQPPAPTTTLAPSPQLPATGGGPDVGAAAFAGLLVLLGAGLIVGTRSRSLRTR